MKDALTAWVVDDDPMWRSMLEVRLKNAQTPFQIKTFKSVDAAMHALEKLPESERPALISTDGDTRSDYTGVDLAAQLRGTGIGVIVVSGNQSKIQQLQTRGCGSAQFIQKEEFGRTDYNASIAKAIEAAKVEKRLGSDNMPGMGQGKGRV